MERLPLALQFQRGWVESWFFCLALYHVLYAMKLYHPPNPIPHPKLLAQLSEDLFFHFLCNRSRWHSDPPAGAVSLPQVGSWSYTHPIQQSGDWRRQCRAGPVGTLVLHPPLPLASVSKAKCWASTPSVRLSKDKGGRASEHSASPPWVSQGCSSEQNIHSHPRTKCDIKTGCCLLTKKIE